MGEFLRLNGLNPNRVKLVKGSSKSACPSSRFRCHSPSPQEIFSPDAIADHFARVITLLRVPWTARPDLRPLVTSQDVTNTCKVRGEKSTYFPRAFVRAVLWWPVPLAHASCFQENGITNKVPDTPHPCNRAILHYTINTSIGTVVNQYNFCVNTVLH